MASLIDSARLVLTDENALIKISVWSVIMFFLNAAQFLSIFGDMKTLGVIGLIVSLPIFVMYWGFLLQTTSLSLAECTTILPKLNPISLFKTGIKGVLSCTIFVLPVEFIGDLAREKLPFPYIQDFGSAVQFILYCFLYIVIYSFASSFFYTSVILFAKRQRILDGLNLVKILTNFHEIIVYLIFTILGLILLNAIISLPILFAIYGLFGIGKIFIFAACMLGVIQMIMLFQNLAQISYEAIKH